MAIVICKNCGAKYSYKEQRIQMRDKDEEKCDICGHVLLKWNGGIHCYDFKHITDGDIGNDDENR